MLEKCRICLIHSLVPSLLQKQDFSINLFLVLPSLAQFPILIPKIVMNAECRECNSDVSCFESGMHFWRRFDPESENCVFKMKLCVQNNTNILNLIVVFPFSVLCQEQPFQVNLVQNFRVVCSGSNLLSILVSICLIQWWLVLYSSQTGNAILDKLLQRF